MPKPPYNIRGTKSANTKKSYASIINNSTFATVVSNSQDTDGTPLSKEDIVTDTVISTTDHNISTPVSVSRGNSSSNNRNNNKKRDKRRSSRPECVDDIAAALNTITVRTSKGRLSSEQIDRHDGGTGHSGVQDCSSSAIASTPIDKTINGGKGAIGHGQDTTVETYSQGKDNVSESAVVVTDEDIVHKYKGDETMVKSKKPFVPSRKASPNSTGLVVVKQHNPYSLSSPSMSFPSLSNTPAALPPPAGTTTPKDSTHNLREFSGASKEEHHRCGQNDHYTQPPTQRWKRGRDIDDDNYNRSRDDALGRRDNRWIDYATTSNISIDDIPSHYEANNCPSCVGTEPPHCCQTSGLCSTHIPPQYLHNISKQYYNGCRYNNEYAYHNYHSKTIANNPQCTSAFHLHDHRYRFDEGISDETQCCVEGWHAHDGYHNLGHHHHHHHNYYNNNNCNYIMDELQSSVGECSGYLPRPYIHQSMCYRSQTPLRPPPPGYTNKPISEIDKGKGGHERCRSGAVVSDVYVDSPLPVSVQNPTDITGVPLSIAEIPSEAGAEITEVKTDNERNTVNNNNNSNMNTSCTYSALGSKRARESNGMSLREDLALSSPQMSESQSVSISSASNADASNNMVLESTSQCVSSPSPHSDKVNSNIAVHNTVGAEKGEGISGEESNAHTCIPQEKDTDTISGANEGISVDGNEPSCNNMPGDECSNITTVLVHSTNTVARNGSSRAKGGPSEQTVGPSTVVISPAPSLPSTPVIVTSPLSSGVLPPNYTNIYSNTNEMKTQPCDFRDMSVLLHDPKGVTHLNTISELRNENVRLHSDINVLRHTCYEFERMYRKKQCEVDMLREQLLNLTASVRGVYRTGGMHGVHPHPNMDRHDCNNRGFNPPASAASSSQSSPPPLHPSSGPGRLPALAHGTASTQQKISRRQQLRNAWIRKTGAVCDRNGAETTALELEESQQLQLPCGREDSHPTTCSPSPDAFITSTSPPNLSRKDLATPYSSGSCATAQQDIALPTPSIRGVHGRFFCETCNLVTNSEISLIAHLNGEKHRKGLMRLAFTKTQSSKQEIIVVPAGASDLPLGLLA